MKLIFRILNFVLGLAGKALIGVVLLAAAYFAVVGFMRYTGGF